MSKLIKLTDDTGELLARRAAADGVTMAEEVKRLLVGDRSREILDRLGRIEEFLMGNKPTGLPALVTNHSLVPEQEEETTGSEEYTELTYGEIMERIMAIEKEMQTDISDEHKKELENELRGLYVDLASAE